jgi:hypothetical protein
MSRSTEERVVRLADMTVTAHERECCTVRFDPVPDSARRRYRLEMTLRATDAAAHVSWRATRARGAGGLAINGHPQAANLDITVTGARLALPPGAPRFPVSVLAACLLPVDVAVVALAFSLFQVLVPSARE